MATATEYDHQAIAAWRGNGTPWDAIGTKCGCSGDTVRKAHSRWKRRSDDGPPAESTPPGEPEISSLNKLVEIKGGGIQRISSLEELVRVLEVDLDEWMVSDFNGNAYEMQKKGGQLATFLQVRANFRRDPRKAVEALTQAREQLLADAFAHAPTTYKPVQRGSLSGDPCVMMLSMRDPHFGLLAWGKEVHQDQDLITIARDYADAVQYLLSFGTLYPVEEIWYTVGDDTSHVNQMDTTGRGGTTAAGTAQDMDGRLSKIFTTIRRSLVAGIDQARMIAPVKVRVVPGNHDPDESYKLGEVLAAWYRNDPEVEVIYSPKRRKFCGYGKNTFMLTHGEEYNRTSRDQLPLIMASECPADLWVASEGGYREIVTGHNHVAKKGRYHPTSDGDESQAIRTTSMPGLTAEDWWHYGQGYRHMRAAVVRFYRHSGGVAGHHEFNL